MEKHNNVHSDKSPDRGSAIVETGVRAMGVVAEPADVPRLCVFEKVLTLNFSLQRDPFVQYHP